MTGVFLLLGTLPLLLLLLFTLFCRYRRRNSSGRRCEGKKCANKKSMPKPKWVIREILKLRAITDFGCRKIADIFNRTYSERTNITVGKTWVYETIKNNRLQIVRMRKKIKNMTPRKFPTNLIWGLDATGKTDDAGVLQNILGVVDAGSRKCLLLRPVDLDALSVIEILCKVIRKFGYPRTIKTDNGPPFQSFMFRGFLWLNGIRHVLSDPCCPWQNGRVERFFGTLKEKLNAWAVAGRDELDNALRIFRFWYNEVRPHQYLGGRTPGECWRGVDPFTTPAEDIMFFNEWDGLLKGLYFVRKEPPET